MRHQTPISMAKRLQNTVVGHNASNGITTLRTRLVATKFFNLLVIVMTENFRTTINVPQFQSASSHLTFCSHSIAEQLIVRQSFIFLLPREHSRIELILRQLFVCASLMVVQLGIRVNFTLSIAIHESAIAHVFTKDPIKFFGVDIRQNTNTTFNGLMFRNTNLNSTLIEKSTKFSLSSLTRNDRYWI